MSAEASVRVSPDVVSQDLGDGLVLLNLRTGIYWGLNRTGAVVWRGIENHAGIEGICRQLREEFDGPEEGFAAAVRNLLSELAEERLIVETAKSREGTPESTGSAGRHAQPKKSSAARTTGKKKK